MDQILDLFSLIFSCFASTQSVTINGKRYKILKLLGEGGFSYVYLIQEAASGQYWALKKVGCSLPEIVNEAMKEVDAYKRFHHGNIIRCHDSTLIQEGQGKTLYLVLPYYKRGNIQDVMNSHAESKTRFQEKEILKFFLGTCAAVEAMHTYTLPKENGREEALSTMKHSRSETEMCDFINQAKEPLLTEQGSGVYDDESAGGGATSRTQDPRTDTKANGGSRTVPYAHRDIKPSNVMIADDGVSPILMDFGSAMRARVEIKTRQDALLQQDLAAEKSTMPYRAPELFNAKTGSIIDEKVDIWSLGCLLFAMAYGHSPYENPADPGGSIAMAVLNNQYRFPTKNDPYSDQFKEIVKKILVSEPNQRPDIHAVIDMTKSALRG